MSCRRVTMTCVPWNMQEYCLVSGQDNPPTAMQGSRAAIHSRQGHGLGRHVRMVWGAQCGLETLTPLEYANKMSKIQECHERKNLMPAVTNTPVSDLVTALSFQGRKRELRMKKAELWSPLGAVIGSSSYLAGVATGICSCCCMCCVLPTSHRLVWKARLSESNREATARSAQHPPPSVQLQLCSVEPFCTGKC